MINRRAALILSAWLTCAAGPQAHKDITLCADLWCPYNCAPGAPHPGFAVEIAQDVFANAGYHVTYQALGWARCIEDARAGRFTAIIGAIPSDAPDFIYPSQPIGISTDGYAVRKGDPFQFTDEHSFDGRVLGTVRSYSFAGAAGAYIAAHANDSRRIEFVSGDDALQKNLAKLLAGRVDVVLDDENVLRNTVAEKGLDAKVTLVHGPSVDPVFIAFSPADPAAKSLAHMLDDGVARLRAGGVLATILATYHLRDGS